MGKEKKESWIEKLIELLNEYEPYIASDGEHKPNLWGYAYQWHSAVFQKELAESYIISARYGFIKWLVENDKIDRERFMNEHLDFEFFKQNYDGEWYWYECVWYYESILCCLAIQDEPIRFLCEILK